MHPDEEQLARLLHLELSDADARAVHSHLARCGECRELLVAAERDEREIFALLRQVDHPLPGVDAAGIVRRARGIGPAWGRRAAGILLFLAAAGAVYALPGSPVREWARAASGWLAGVGPTTPAPRQAEAPVSGAAGIAAPPGKHYVIVFQSTDAAGQVRVSLTDGTEVTVRALGGQTRFTSAADRLLVDNQGPGGVFEIEIPRSAPWLEIRVKTRRVFLKQGVRIVTRRSPEGKGDYVIGLSP